MSLFYDLDGPTWVMTITALCVSIAVATIDLRDWHAKLPIRSRFKRAVLWGFAMLCGISGIDTITNASDAQHLSITGVARVVRVLHGGRSGDTWLIRIAGPDQVNSPICSLHARSLSAFREHPIGRAAIFSYLNEPKEEAADLFAFEVVDMADAETGLSFYHFDTQHHPYRASILLGDAAVLFLTGVLSGLLSDASPDTEDDYENYRDKPNSQDMISELTSLDLNAIKEKANRES